MRAKSAVGFPAARAENGSVPGEAVGRSARRYTLRGASWRADSVSSPGPLLVETPPPLMSCRVMFACLRCLRDVCLRGDGRSRCASLHPRVATARPSAAICQRRRPNNSSPTPARCAGLLSARPEGYPRPNSGAALPVALRVERDGPSDSHKGPAPRVETRARPVLLGSKTSVGNSAAVDVPERGRRW
ncbi:hypothetical protein C8Q73DRAFT_715189 [Cubamyces lactineus]|nr:hypothetical protein C8Q73DRAFT_715189 [Cubamyces lactineus]